MTSSPRLPNFENAASTASAYAVRAVELIGKHHGMFTDRLEVDSPLEGLGERMARALKRQAIEPETETVQ